MVFAVLCIAAVPFLQVRSDRADRKAAAKVELKQQAQARAGAYALLHTFDCTYGTGLKVTLTQLANSAERTAVQTKRLSEAQAARGAAAAARASLKISQQQRASAATLRQLHDSLQPLAPGMKPCPPR